MLPSDIRPIESSPPLSGGGDRSVPVVHRRRSDRRRPLDQVELTQPIRAVLALLRERVLENTRLNLELTREVASRVAFAPPPKTRVDVFVGRLLSSQNLLAARRRGDWEPERIADALEEAMTDGLAETLQILYELEQLDHAAWSLLCAVLDEFHRKVLAEADDLNHH